MNESAAADHDNDALNAICPYWTMFPLGFPLAVLADASPGDWVLDPFCGRGTTLYAARKIGLQAVGIDSNEVAVAIAAAKLVEVSPRSVAALAEELMTSSAPVTRPEGEFWSRCFAPGVLDALCCLRTGLAHRDDRRAVALRAVLLGALHGPRNKGAPSYFSNQMPRTYSTKPKSAVSFWRKRDLQPVEVDVLGIIERHAERRFTHTPKPTGGAVHHGEARTVLRRLRRRFDWVITSPPYPGMVTYRPDGWLRGWMLGGPAEPDYRRDGQLGAVTGSQFTARLADIWRVVAERCAPSARLAVRFGALPSCRGDDPGDLLLQSLELSGAWQVTNVKDAGPPRRWGARQADQAVDAGELVPELDLFAVRGNADV